MSQIAQIFLKKFPKGTPGQVCENQRNLWMMGFTLRIAGRTGFGRILVTIKHE